MVDMDVGVLLVHVIMISCKTLSHGSEPIAFCRHHNALTALSPIEMS
ncbi:hypothetical protein PA08_2352 [Cutibacterium modestum P08]|nr:hypothetical protein PA08_2352 [Cutibacterium modestum P08]